MARPTKISDERILDAARRVFLERGISGTTAEVARVASVAEGSIFKRWKTKQELFFAALAPDDVDPPWLSYLSERVGCGDLQTHLAEVGQQAIDFFRRLMPLMMMSWSNPSANGIPAPLDRPNSKPVRVLKKLAGYFEAEMRLGRIARRDPEVVARIFVGGIQQFAFLELITRSHHELPLPDEMFVRGLVNLIWNGIHPTEKSAPPKERKRR
jgi:AcrR family transcriptional regulator